MSQRWHNDWFPLPGEAVFDRTRFLGRRHFDGIAVSVPQTPVATQAAVLERLRAAFSG